MRADGGTGRGAAEWFESELAAGRVQEDLARRYFTEGLRARLLVPRRVRAGEPFTAALRVEERGRYWQLHPCLAFAGYRVGDAREPLGREAAPVHSWRFSPHWLSGLCDVLPAVLTIEKPGRATVRVDYWVVYARGYQHEVPWLDGDELGPWQGEVYRRREALSATIEVE